VTDPSAERDGHATAAMTRPVVAVVVNYNAASHLVTCVASLRANGVDPVMVVDNGSTDGSRAALATADPAAKWIDAGANLGYGRAVNAGVAHAPDGDLLVCNPDVILDTGAVDALSARLDEDPRLGVVGPTVRNLDRSVYPSAREFPDLVDAVGHGLLGMVAPRNRFTRRYRMLDWDHASPADVDWVSGACLLARRQAWDEVGGFDHAYFMYLEDVDLCWRIRRRGWTVGYEPAAGVTHEQGVSTNLHPYRMIAEHHRSMWRFARQSLCGWKRLLLPVLGAGLVARVAVACIEHRFAGPPRPANRSVDPRTASDGRRVA
jgi:N-acetylglucosaminyl-diphospho-decaprenol L-rhamnosyltransferase